MKEEKQIVVYNSEDGKVSFDVNLDKETVWLTMMQMTELFNTTKQNVSLHINNIYKEEELLRKATVKEYLIVQIEGKRKVERLVRHYNLDVVISVGYRVKSKRGVQFRQWATRILKEHLIKGYSFNERRISLLEVDNKQMKEKIAELAAFVDAELRSRDIHLYPKGALKKL